MGLSAVGLHGVTRRGTPRIGAVRRLTVPLQGVTGRRDADSHRSRDTGRVSPIRDVGEEEGRGGTDARTRGRRCRRRDHRARVPRRRTDGSPVSGRARARSSRAADVRGARPVRLPLRGRRPSPRLRGRCVLDASGRDRRDARAADGGRVRRPAAGGARSNGSTSSSRPSRGRTRHRRPARTGTSGCSASTRSTRGAASGPCFSSTVSGVPTPRATPATSRRSRSGTCRSTSATASISSWTRRRRRPASTSGASTARSLAAEREGAVAMTAPSSRGYASCCQTTS